MYKERHEHIAVIDLSLDMDIIAAKNTLRISLSRKMGTFIDHVSWVSGWMHDFVCPDCSSQLRYVSEDAEYEKNNFFCPNCGRYVSGQVYKNAWVYFWRREFAEKMIMVLLYRMLLKQSGI